MNFGFVLLPQVFSNIVVGTLLNMFLLICHASQKNAILYIAVTICLILFY